MVRRTDALPADPGTADLDALQREPARWADVLQGQRARCHARQQRTGLPAHLLAQLEDFLRRTVPEGPDVILAGE